VQMTSFFLNDQATTEISPLSLHDALPISWINYAIPVHAAVPGATVTVTVNGKEEQQPLTMPLFVRLGMEAKYKAVPRKESAAPRSEEHTSELQSLTNLVCRLLLEKKKNTP